LFFTALVLKNYVYRRHSSIGGSGGPLSPATSTTSTDDGTIKLSFLFLAFLFIKS